MRRIALITAATITLATGSAAFAATDASAPTAMPDPYLGSWSLSVDGGPAAPVMNLEGCSVYAAVATGRDGKHVAQPIYQPCAFDVGAGTNLDWVNAALAGTGRLHKVVLTRTDKAGYAFELSNASLASLTLPKVNRGSVDPIFLKLTVRAELVRRVRASGGNPVRLRPFSPATLAVTLGGAPLDVAVAGPWTVELKQAESTIGSDRDYTPQPAVPEIGDLPLRVPEAVAATQLEPWLQAAVLDGKTDERALTLTLGNTKGATLDIALENTGPAQGDLAPRADNNRTFTVYAERASLAVR